MKGINSQGQAIRVMAVDDSSITRKMIKKALEPEGFCITGEASNGREAVDLYTSLKPDVITMDVTMPVMDGLDAALAIKKIDPTQKIIMISAMGDNDIVTQARTCGIDDFCFKPFKADDLVIKILEVLRT